VPITEAQLPRPVGIYGVTKLAWAPRRSSWPVADGLDAVVLRVFNPVGRGAPPSSLPGRLVAQFADAGGRDEITLGPLGAVRDFVDARDVAGAVLAAITAPAVATPVLNVAAGQGVPVRTLVDTPGRHRRLHRHDHRVRERLRAVRRRALAAGRHRGRRAGARLAATDRTARFLTELWQAAQ